MARLGDKVAGWLEVAKHRSSYLSFSELARYLAKRKNVLIDKRLADSIPRIMVSTQFLRPIFVVTCVCASVVTTHAVNAWTLVWTDEFQQADGSAPDSTKWAFDLGGNGWGNNELQTYTDRRVNSRIEGGKLILEAHKETFTGSDGIQRSHTSARLKTLGKASWQFGRVEARLKLPVGKGLWPAFWMLGTNFPTIGWPACGEIDIMEHIGREPSKIYGTVHGPGYSGSGGIGGSLTMSNGVAAADDFHLFAIEWETNRIRWFVDNQLYFTVTPASLPGGAQWVFDHNHFLLLNVAVGGNWPGSPDATTTFPQRMEVDYVRVYARTNAPELVLQLRRSGAQIEVMWPGEFPNGRLFGAASFGQTWQEIAVAGVRQDGYLLQPVAPGFYRIGWLP
jgi:beta-glucanase (GH16 family)